MKGKLITIEGLDGSGKATQAKLLCNALEKEKIHPVRISFPDYAEKSSTLVKMYLGGEFGNSPGDVNAYAASSFYAVHRYASYMLHWKQPYRSGALIVADRYTTSNVVYQLPKQPRENWNSLADWLLDFEYNKLGLPVPDLTIFLDVDPDASQILLSRRYRGSAEKRDIHESNFSYLRACRESALYAAERFGWKTIPCMKEGRLKTIAEIHSELLKVVRKELHLYATI